MADPSAAETTRGVVSHPTTDEELFGELYPRLRSFAAVVAPPEVAPDDLVQDAVAKALRGGALVDLDAPQAYLRRSIANLAKNHRRRWARDRIARSRLGGSSRHALPEYPSDLADLQRLSPIERGAVFLHDVEGWSFAETARQLGCSEVAARKAASRGRNRLAHLLEDER